MKMNKIRALLAKVAGVRRCKCRKILLPSESMPCAACRLGRTLATYSGPKRIIMFLASNKERRMSRLTYAQGRYMYDKYVSRKKSIDMELLGSMVRGNYKLGHWKNAEESEA